MHEPKTPQLNLPKDLLQQWRQVTLAQGKKNYKVKPKAHKVAPKSKDDLTTQELIRKNKKSIEDLWLTFNRDRQDLFKHYLSTEKAAFHYLLGFHLPNVARAYGTLLRLEERYPQLSVYLKNLAKENPKQPASTKARHPIISWTDFGCGTGAMAQATLYWLKRHINLSQIPVSVDLTDLSSHLLTYARGLLETDPKIQPAHVKTRRFGLEDLFITSSKDNASLPLSSVNHDRPLFGISLGYVWNELTSNPKARAKMLQLFTHHVEKDHDVLAVIVEPASEHHAKAAMKWRDQLVQLGYHPLYPCPRGTGPCPMLSSSKDWCFSEFVWTQPVEHRLLDKLLGSDRKFLATTSYVFASPQLWRKLHANQVAQEKIVVGRPTIKGKVIRGGSPQRDTFDYLVCNGKTLRKAPPPNLLPIKQGSLKAPSTNQLETRSKEDADILCRKLRGTTFD